MNDFKHLRIHPIPQRLGTCVVCGRLRNCAAFDHDLAQLNSGQGDVCLDSVEFGAGCIDAVINAEHALRDAQLAIPTDSILEDGQ